MTEPIDKSMSQSEDDHLKLTSKNTSCKDACEENTLGHSNVLLADVAEPKTQHHSKDDSAVIISSYEPTSQSSKTSDNSNSFDSKQTSVNDSLSNTQQITSVEELKSSESSFSQSNNAELINKEEELLISPQDGDKCTLNSVKSQPLSKLKSLKIGDNSSNNESKTSQTNLSPTNVSANNLSQEYHLKWIKWKGNSKVPIVTQNSNGSCPLLAIINVLLLRNNIYFPPMIEIVTASQLMEYLCDCILNNAPKNLPESVKLNYEQNFQDAMSILPRLTTGLDVNVRFTGISDFEYTSECIIFDLLHIPLYHGWLLDPAHPELSRIVNNLSYNQLVDRIITNKSSTDSNVLFDMFIAEEFLKQSASQLTNHGLSKLIHCLKEDELCILFRNNHFITLYKYKSKLYQLVTDQGFLTEPNVVWESLNNIEGDTYFVDSDFVLVPPKPAVLLQQPSTFSNTQQQIDQDYLIALSLEQEQKLEHQHTASTSSNAAADKAVSQVGSCLSDEELAKKLQAEEDQMFERVQKQQKLVSSSSPPNRSKGPASSAVVNHSDRNIQNNSPLQQASRSGHHHHHHHPHQATTHRTDTRVSSDRHSSEANSDRDSVTSRSKTKNCAIC